MDNSDQIVTLLAVRSGAGLPQPWTATLAARLSRYGTRFEIEPSPDLVDLLELWLSVEPQAPGSRYVRGLMRVVLSHGRWPIAARIAFLRRHLARVHLPSLDDDVVGDLFGADQEPST